MSFLKQVNDKNIYIINLHVQFYFSLCVHLCDSILTEVNGHSPNPEDPSVYFDATDKGGFPYPSNKSLLTNKACEVVNKSSKLIENKKPTQVQILSKNCETASDLRNKRIASIAIKNQLFEGEINPDQKNSSLAEQLKFLNENKDNVNNKMTNDNYTIEQNGTIKVYRQISDNSNETSNAKSKNGDDTFITTKSNPLCETSLTVKSNKSDSKASKEIKDENVDATIRKYHIVRSSVRASTPEKIGNISQSGGGDGDTKIIQEMDNNPQIKTNAKILENNIQCHKPMMRYDLKSEPIDAAHNLQHTKSAIDILGTNEPVLENMNSYGNDVDELKQTVQKRIRPVSVDNKDNLQLSKDLVCNIILYISHS